jgi:3-deoxy-D-manno-octulosonic-acid transferase
LIDFIYNKIVLPLLTYFFKNFSKNKEKFLERERIIEESWAGLKKYPHLQKRVLIHSASMGEFEQVKPIIEELKAKDDSLYIICSFFSPSGLNNAKNYKFADKICYLPIDTDENMERFVQSIKPDIAIIVRYEIWRNLIRSLFHKHIPIILVNATMPTNNFFRTCFLPRKYLFQTLSLLTTIFTAGSRHTHYFDGLHLKNTEVRTLTDTRFDRIVKYSESINHNEILDTDLFDADELIIVAGSIWNVDEDIIIKAVANVRKSLDVKIRVIYVPHEPTEENLDNLCAKLGPHILYSKLIQCYGEYTISDLKEKINYRDFVIDKVGILLSLYSFADIAYIGGAFGDGIHSVTEAAVYGIPIISGPKLEKSTDAKNLTKNKALKTINNTKELEDWLKLLIVNKEYRKDLGRMAKEYVYNSAGSSKIVIDRILDYLNENEKIK